MLFKDISSDCVFNYLKINIFAMLLKEKSKVFKYAKWPSKWLAKVTSLRFNEIKNEIKCLCWFFIDFIFCRLAENAVSGSPSVTWLSEVTSVWGVSAVAILDCALNVYACGRQKALTVPAYCVAANCNNSQATQSITVYEFPRSRPVVKQKWVKFIQFKWADFDAAPQSCPFV